MDWIATLFDVGAQGMEYFQEANHKIRAGFALNAGKLLAQYEKSSESYPSNERYDVTLTICVLQSISTSCWETVKAMRKNNHHLEEIWNAEVPDVPTNLGISSAFVKSNTFVGSLTYGAYLTHIRNALSHPTFSEKSPKLPATGFTTSNKDQMISAVRFVDSPWVDRGRFLSKYENRSQKEMSEILEEFLAKFSLTPEEAGFSVRLNKNRRCQIFHGDDQEPYYPVFEAHFPVQKLKVLALELANYIAQPAVPGWNGQSIRTLVA